MIRKFFEHINNYYSETSYTVLVDVISGGGDISSGGDRTIVFTLDELKIIRNIIPDEYITNRRFNFKSDTFYTFISFDNLDNGSRIRIWKIVDEWFLVCYRYNNKDLCYKCDQIEGLVKFLEDKIKTI